MGRSAKDDFCQSREVNLLTQVDGVLFQQPLRRYVVREPVEGVQITTVEGKEEFPEPGVVFGLRKGVEDGVEEKLSKVVDAA